jgi:hypothetical protein
MTGICWGETTSLEVCWSIPTSFAETWLGFVGRVFCGPHLGTLSQGKNGRNLMNQWTIGWTKPVDHGDFFCGSSMVDMFFSIIPKCWGGDNGHTAMMAAGLSLLVVGVFGFLSLCIYAAYMMPKWSAGGIPGHSIEQLPEPWLMCYFNGLCYPVRWELSWSIVGTPINQYKEITWPEIRWVIMFVELFLGEPWPQHLRTRLATKWGIVHEFAARDLYLTWCEIEETQNA